MTNHRYHTMFSLTVIIIAFFFCCCRYNAVEVAGAQIYVMHNDGSGLRQLTTNGTNLWPTFLSNKRILFASNDILGHATFNIFAANIDGSDLEKVWTVDENCDPKVI